MKQDDKVYPFPLTAEDESWLAKQDKATLIEVIGQMAYSQFAWRAMLDEAILRGYRNGLEAKRNAVDAEWRLLHEEVMKSLDGKDFVGFDKASKNRDRCEDKSDALYKQIDASWKLNAGFHREKK